MTTIAGSASLMGNTDGVGASARFRFPFGITTDGTSLFVTDRSNHRIRKIDITSAAVSTLAGSSAGYVNGNGSAARFRSPRGITTDGTYLYVADGANHAVRRIDIATAVVDTVAGPAPDLMDPFYVDCRRGRRYGNRGKVQQSLRDHDRRDKPIRVRRTGKHHPADPLRGKRQPGLALTAAAAAFIFPPCVDC